MTMIKKYILVGIIGLSLLIPSGVFAAKAFDVDTGGTLTTNLVSWYNLEDVNDEFSTNTLTNNGSATFTTGKINNAVNLVRASSQYLSDGTLSYGGSAYSISGWFNPSSQPTSGQLYTMAAVSDSTSDTILWIGYYNNAGTYQIFGARTKFGVADEGPAINQTLTTGTWYHIAITYDGSNVRTYLNGSLLGGPTASSGSGSNGANSRSEIGTGAADSLTNLTDGKIDLVGFWGKALSSTEITDLYNSGNGNAYREPVVASTAPQMQIVWFE